MMKASLPERLPIRGWEWLGHYGLPIQSSALAVVLIYVALFVSPVKQQSSGAIDAGGLIVLSSVFLTIAGVVLYRQRRVLTLEHLKTKNDAEGNFRALLWLAKNEGWRVNVVGQNKHLRMHVPARWFDPCWGEMVSVLFEADEVALSSICDPTKPRPSIASFGRNARNLAKVKGALDVI
jgi:hypothetical protein